MGDGHGRLHTDWHLAVGFFFIALTWLRRMIGTHLAEAGGRHLVEAGDWHPLG